MFTNLLIGAGVGLMIGGVIMVALYYLLIKKKVGKGSSVDVVDEGLKESKRQGYETLLVEARTRCTELESQLKNALDGRGERPQSLTELQERIRGLEEELVKNEKVLSKAKEKLSLKDSQIRELQDSFNKEQEKTTDLHNTVESIKREQEESVTNLKKKIKAIEDDLEEKEDDLSDAKKRLSRKDDEISDLQNSLYTEQKKSKVLQNDLEGTKEDLKEAIAKLNLNKESLGFIQEILNAPDESTEDVVALAKKVDQMESFIKGQYMDLNAFLCEYDFFTWGNDIGKTGYKKKKEYLSLAFDQWASTKKKSWLDGKTTIAFIGEFSAGKTSIVNRILSQDNPNVLLLPVSVTTATAIPTYIAGGKETRYNFVTRDGHCKRIREDTFKKVSKDILGQIAGVSLLLKYFVMTYSNPDLQGLSILDTPGFSSKDKEDNTRTFEVINESDALFWVVDINAGNINQSSLSIIKEKLIKPFFIVINKVEMKADSEVDEFERTVKQTLANEGLSAQGYIRFSQKTPLHAIMEPIKTVAKISVRNLFLNDVDDDLTTLLTILDNTIKTKYATYNAAFQKGEDITGQFKTGINKLRADCDSAQSIPRFKEGFKVFGVGTDDKYIMTVPQTHQLQNLLSTIAGEHMQNLDKIFNKRVKKAEEIQQAWADVRDIENAWQKTYECYRQFSKLKNSF